MATMQIRHNLNSIALAALLSIFRLSTFAQPTAFTYQGSLNDGTVTANKIATVSNWFGLKIANPSPGNEDWFGSAVAVLGNDRLLVGAEREDIGAADAGVVYLFSNVYRPAGNVGIGIAAPAFQLQLSTDSAGKPNGGSWANSSDARIKKNIRPLNGALENLLQLRGVSFEWLNPEDHAGQSGPQAGFIAQEVERVFPHWVQEIPGAEHDRAVTPEGRVKSLTLPFEFDALAVEAVKAQQQQIKARDETVQRLEQRVTELETLLNDLKARVQP